MKNSASDRNGRIDRRAARIDVRILLIGFSLRNRARTVEASSSRRVELLFLPRNERGVAHLTEKLVAIASHIGATLVTRRFIGDRLVESALRLGFGGRIALEGRIQSRVCFGHRRHLLIGVSTANPPKRIAAIRLETDCMLSSSARTRVPINCTAQFSSKFSLR